MTSPELHTLDLFSCLYYAVCNHQTIFLCKLVTESAFHHCICFRSSFVSLTLSSQYYLTLCPLPAPESSNIMRTSFRVPSLRYSPAHPHLSIIFSDLLWHKPSQTSQLKCNPSIKDLPSFRHSVAPDLEPQLPWRFPGHWKDLLPLTDHNNAYQGSGVDFDMMGLKFGDIGLIKMIFP